MNIVKGATKPKGLRVIIYGVAGVGKTTLAAKLPNALFLDYEGGTHGIAVDKLAADDLPKSYDGMKGLVAELRRDRQGYERLVIDTADRFEQTLSAALAKERKVEDVFAANDYGRTVAAHKAGMASVLDALTELAKSGMDVVVLAHETSRKVEPLESRDATGTYDHHELKLSKTVSPLFMEWADCVIFCAYKTFLVSGERKADKARVDGGKRWCFASYSNDWDAKTRTGIGIPEDCPLDRMAELLPNAMAAAVDRGAASAQAAPKPPDAPKAVSGAKAEPAGKRADKAAPAPKEERESVASLRRLCANHGVTPEQVMGYLAANPKVKERFGSTEGMAFEDLPDSVAAWLSKGMEIVAKKIRNA